MKVNVKAIRDKALGWWQYVSTDIWRDEADSMPVRIIKTLNLSVRSFLNHDIQTQACAMTYRTLLAIVPALALLFAIGRGFGLQSYITKELYAIFPAQRRAVEYAMNFVDSYLSQSSEGIFVGVGIGFLLWTLISLISNIEDTFNLIWGVKQGRSYGRKITDYTAMLLILPVLLICIGGLTVMLSSSIRALFDFEFLSPVVSLLLEGFSWLLTWLFFAMLYVLIPNTKVRFSNAFVAGVFAGTGFMILQWIFVTGQMYVARYNAIYGSFSFLPLMLIWAQLTWVVVLAGGVICYSMQNIFLYSFDSSINNISSSYYARIILAVSTIAVRRFVDGSGAMVITNVVRTYGLPPRLVSLMCDKLVKAGVLSPVEVDPRRDIMGYQPAIDPARLTVKELFDRLNAIGSSDFLPSFEANFPGVVDICRRIKLNEDELTSRTLLSDIKIVKPTQTPTK